MSGPEGLSGAVVIATKDRPAELARCLASLRIQTEPAQEVVVVDASSGPETQHAVEQARGEGLAVEYVSSPVASTTAQRAEGIRRTRAPIVHFLDDDVELEPGYLAAIHDCYRADPALAGAGGLPTNLPGFRPGWLRRLLAPGSTRQGAVLPSGRAVLVYRADRPMTVDWLSGCCMSFTRRALVREGFDETATGYVLGEDVDIGYRIRQLGPLVITPYARLVHHESPVNRLGWREWAARDIVNRHHRVVAGTGRYSLPRFWLGALGQVAVWAARSLLPSDRRARQMLAGSVAGLVRLARR